MIQGIYNSAASLSALERWQESISENLASSTAAGYKKTDLTFEAIASQKSGQNEGSALPTEDIGMMPKTNSAVNFTAGELRQTGKDTDFAVQGPGFFQVRKPGNELAYTRDGEFHVNADGTLVTKQGYEVMGDGGPLVINPQAGAVRLGSDGTITQGGTDAGQGSSEVGKLQLRDFGDPSVLERQDGGFFAAPKGVTPTLVEKPSLTQGAIETSNVSPLTEMVNLISVSRAYEASQRMITSHDDMLRQAIQTLGNPQA